MVFTEKIELVDGVTPAARAARTALADMGNSLKAAQASLVKAGALGDKAGFATAAADIDKYKQGIANLKGTKGPGTAGPDPAAAGAGKGISSMFADAAHVSQVAKESIGAAITDIGNSFKALAQGDAKGAVTGLFDAVADLSKMLDLLVPGLGAAVSAIIKIAGGLVGITVGLVQSGMEFAIASSQAKQQMLAMFDAMGDGVGTGEELDNMLSNLADKIGISKDTLAPLTKAFLQMGVTGTDALEKLTLAAISANAIVGEGGAEAFTSLQKKIQLAAQTGGKITLDPKFLKMVNASGAKIDDLAKGLGLTAAQLKGASVDADKLGDVLSDAVIARGAKPLERLANSFGEIKKKFMQDIGDLFEDIDVAPFMKEVKDLFGIFGQANPSGQALKSGIMAFFQETFDIAKKLVPMVKHFMLDLIIYGLQAYIALKPSIAALKEWLNSAEGISTMTTLWEVAKFALTGIAIAVGVVVAIFLTLAAVLVTASAAFGLVLGSVIALSVTIAETLVGLVTTAVEAGTNFVTGLITGITGGASAVSDAVKNLASGAYKSFTDFFQISSPSKLMQTAGGYIGEGTVVGIADAQNDVAAAVGTVSAKAVGAVADTPPPAASTAVSAGGVVVPINIYAKDGQQAREIAEEVYAIVMERLALATGT